MSFNPDHSDQAAATEEIRGILERITFQNQENGYTVARLQVQDSVSQKPGEKTATVVGHLTGAPVGSTLLLRGEWLRDPRYGKQFKAVSYEVLTPNTLNGLERYLGSGLIKGIGPKFARRIVQRFGLKTIEILERDPGRLAEVSGLGRKRLLLIKKAWAAQKDIHQIMVFLQAHGISAAYAVKIYKTYGAASLKTVKSNPYRLAEDIWGIGFRIADDIAMSLGLPANDPRRIRAGLLFSLHEAKGEGHCYLPRTRMFESVERLLNVGSSFSPSAPESGISLFQQGGEGEIQVAGLIEDGKIVADGDCFYPALIYHAESGFAARILELGNKQPFFLRPEADRAVKKAEGFLKLNLAPEQAEALAAALCNRVSVITGGPGTGKSTILKGLILTLDEKGISVKLAAPTGRAAKRLGEACGREAMTIHRLLEFDPSIMGFKRNSENPLEAEFVIIDEASMMDIVLASSLVRAVRDGASLLLVGDADQLPSVGPGNVLRDIIDSGSVSVVRLERIFRQGRGSLISLNASLINAGKSLELLSGYEGEKDFYCIFRDEPQAIEEEIISLCGGRLTKKYGFEPFLDIQVLTPMRKGIIGSENLNLRLREVMNPGGLASGGSGVRFAVGDKVMQVRNNYDKEAFNGDLGRVCGLDNEEQVLRVNFDGRRIEYDFAELNDLALAYAATVHKSQGSEFPCVIVPIHTTHYPLLQRNLLYTAITRGKKMVVIVGSKKAIAVAVRNNRVRERNTGLGLRLTAK